MPQAASTPHALSHGDVAAQRQGAGGRGKWFWQQLLTSAELYDPASGSWSATGSLNIAHRCTLRRCCRTARCWWQQDKIATATFYERGTVRSNQRELECHRQPQHRTRAAHGDIAAQRQGAGGSGIQWRSRSSNQRGTVRPASASWSATGSLNTAREMHTATLLPNGKVLVAGGFG